MEAALDNKYIRINHMMDDRARHTMAIFAAKKGKVKVLEMLLDRGANMRHADINGMTAVSPRPLPYCLFGLKGGG